MSDLDSHVGGELRVAPAVLAHAVVEIVMRHLDVGATADDAARGAISFSTTGELRPYPTFAEDCQTIQHEVAALGASLNGWACREVSSEYEGFAAERAPFEHDRVLIQHAEVRWVPSRLPAAQQQQPGDNWLPLP